MVTFVPLELDNDESNDPEREVPRFVASKRRLPVEVVVVFDPSATYPSGNSK